MQAMETEPPAPLQVEEELGERAAATTPSSMAAAVMLAALPQAHLLAPGAHGAAAAVVPLLAIGQGLGLEPMRSGGPLKRAPARSLLCVCVCVCVCLSLRVCAYVELLDQHLPWLACRGPPEAGNTRSAEPRSTATD